MLILHQLLREHPELEEDDTKLYIYFKTRFSNYIKDVLRQQESQKRRFNRMSYEEVGEIEHCLSSAVCNWMNIFYFVIVCLHINKV